MSELTVRRGSKPTPRELEVARAVLHADSRKQAANELGISPETVKVHLARLRLRLGAKHNAELFYVLRDHLAA